MSSESQSAEAILRLIWFVSAVLLMSPVILMGVAFLIIGRSPESGSEVGQDFGVVLYSLAFVCLVIAFKVRSFILRRMLKHDERTGQIDTARLRDVLLTSTIISFAFVEAAAIFGFVQGFLTRSPAPVFVCGTAALLVGILLWPRKSSVNDFLPPAQRIP